MEFLLNPNLAYLILVFAGMLLILAIISPGTGLLGARRGPACDFLPSPERGAASPAAFAAARNGVSAGR